MRRLTRLGPEPTLAAERFVLSIKSECLDRMVLIGERHLRRPIESYVEHYHLGALTRGSAIVRSKSFQNPPRARFYGTSGWAGS